jgi:hypothetical protein
MTSHQGLESAIARAITRVGVKYRATDAVRAMESGLLREVQQLPQIRGQPDLIVAIDGAIRDADRNPPRLTAWEKEDRVGALRVILRLIVRHDTPLETWLEARGA